MTAQLDPATAQALTLLPSFDTPGMTPTGCRQMLRALAAARADAPLPQVASVEDTTIAGGVRARIYRPASSITASPTVAFFHGGGWVAGDLETHDRQARLLAIEAGVVVVSVDYRQPPEARFPAAFDDAFAAARWVVEHANSLGGLPGRVGVAGDSAGGNLAAATAIACRDAGVALAAQMLVYPVTDVAGGYLDAAINGRYPSRTQNATGYFLTLQSMQWFAGHYLNAVGESVDMRVSPLRAASLAGVAPAVVCSARFDPLRDEGIAYAQALRDAGVAVREHRGVGLIHGYVGMAAISPAAAAEATRARRDFRELLDRD